ncbi:MAG: type II secretion system protein GspG [Gemmatimonadota bacterium]
MLLAFIATACLALPAVQQIEDPAALVPQETLVFFGTHSVRISSQSAKNSAMNQILSEPEVKAFLQKPVAAAQAVIDGAIKDSGIAEAEGRHIALTDMMSGAGDGPPVGKMFLALTHFSLMANGKEGGGFPDVGLVMGVELLDANDLGLVKALWSRIPAPEESANHNGHDYFHKTGEEGWSVSLAFLGNLAVVSSSDTTLFDMMERHDGKAKAGSSLADNGDYKKLLASGGGLRAGSSTSFVRVGAMVDIAKAALAVGAQMKPEFAELGPKIVAAIDNLGIHALRWVGSVSSRDANGRVLSTSATSIEKGASGLLPHLLSSELAFDLSRLQRVPGNSLSLAAGSIDGLGEVYDFIMNTFESVAPEQFAQAQGVIKQVMGESDLRKDLFANLHGNFVSFSVPGEGFPGTPAGVMRVGLNDPDAFAAAMKALATNASAMFAADTPVTLKESDHEGHRLFELDLSRTPLAMAMIQPAFAFEGNELVLSVDSPKTLKSDLNGSVGTGSITENKELMDFVAEIGKSGVVRSIGFSNTATTFGSMYGQLSGAASMFGGALGGLPLDLSLLPTEGSITRHMGSSYSAGYADKDGTTFIGRDVSEFAIADFVPLIITAGALAVASASGETLVQARETTPEEHVQEDLAQISAGMTVYKISEGAYPSSIDDLVRPLANYPDGCLGKATAPVDPWGNAYRYKLNEKKKPFLWSIGADGVDEQGAGDDIIKAKR